MGNQYTRPILFIASETFKRLHTTRKMAPWFLLQMQFLLEIATEDLNRFYKPKNLLESLQAKSSLHPSL